MSIEEALDGLRRKKGLRENIVHWEVRPARPGRGAPLPADLHPALTAALRALGMERLYSHQAEAYRRVRAGEDVVVATPTASGKSLCYHLPVYQALLEDGDATALYLFPTKALSRDQLAAMERIHGALGRAVRAAVYDGDTPAEVRRSVRHGATLVLTNPYMLHTGILPNHARWVRFFRALRYVVVDETHTLTGVFGSHFANVMRRLLRICRHYGSDPRFVFASATLAEPAALASQLAGRPVSAVEEDGSPRGEKHFIFYNPPVVQPALGVRRSGLEEARRLAVHFAEAGARTIVFCRTRTAVEVMVKYLRDHYDRKGRELSRVRAYRGGYLPLLRREIEAGLRDGAVDIVVATNALELGVDIGSLDACILTGYPGSVASTLQQAGRSGRKRSPSAAVVVGRSHATDQYVMHHPDYVLGRSPEAGAVDPDNLIIRVNQMKCAAFELPFTAGERFGGEGGDTEAILDYLAEEGGILRRSRDRYYWMSRAFPAEKVSLHAGDMDNFTVYAAGEGRVIGEVDRPSAMSLIHPGAVYGHEGETYVVEALDYPKRRALAARTDTDYYTQAEVETEIRVQHLDRTERHGAYAVHRGEIGVTKTAVLFKKIRFYTGENIGTGSIDLPPEEMHTEAFFLTLEDGTAEAAGLHEGGRGTAFHGFASLFHRVVPLFVRCDIADLGFKAEIRSSFFDRPALVIFDAIPGGVGLSEKALELHRTVLRAVREVLEQCPCPAGCPGCVNPSPEGTKGHKEGARALARLLAAPEKGGKRYAGRDGMERSEAGRA